MDTIFIISVAAGILIIGSLVALWWWKLARKIAPYRDEMGKPGTQRPRDDHEVIVISPPNSASKN